MQADLTTIDLAPDFDAVVANMVFLSIREWMTALGTCIRALRMGGRLVFSLEHPCAEDGDYFTERSVPRRYAADVHRPLSHYLNGVIRAGCQLEEIAEPALESSLVAQGPPGCEALVRRPGYLVVSALRSQPHE